MRLLIYIVILCLTIWAGVFLQKNPGNLELTYKDWIIDMPLWLPILGGITLLFLVTLLFSLFSVIGRTYRRFREWLSGSSMRTMLQNTNEAKILLLEGDWVHAENKILKAVKKSDSPLHCYLLAAQAAQELGAIDRRDEYLNKALRVAPSAKVAILLKQADLQFVQGQYEHCLVTIQQLQKLAPHNRRLLKLATDVYSATGAWNELAKLLPQLNKYNVFAADVYTMLEVKTYIYLLRNVAKKKDKDNLMQYWDSLPRHVRHHIEIIECYAQLLLNLQEFNEVEHLLRSQLKKTWDSKLVRIYGLTLADVNKQISTAENWLKTHNDDTALLLALARLCMANKLWGKARNYLDEALAIEANPDIYAELGRLLGFLGEQQKSLECYKTGLLEFADVLPFEQTKG